MKGVDLLEKKELEKRIEELHYDSKVMLSELEFVVDEVRFFTGLLNSYTFMPHIENMFHESHNLKKDLLNVKRENSQMLKKVHHHDNQLGGMMESNRKKCASDYINQHQEIKSRINQYLEKFREIKKRVFCYSNSILLEKKC
ncbi:hypothetical protein [Abyssalbus ytuae]|uniref:Uncharacterized protein n=1 Tax=Abyssalbus ytuae TaxID=2926907 RepID=A0A9E7D3J5_9FLAO|nr:hypothetical protein [Abyssalbus ytuae]UOB17919.1 hypothetical protein MQE35_01150 [Abyssalbus ytuae]